MHKYIKTTIDSKILANVDVLTPLEPLKPLRISIPVDLHIYEPDGEAIISVIPAGFITDGASVPPQFHRVFPPMGMYLMAAICHDSYCEQANSTGVYRIREYGDENFYQWCRWCGVSRFRARAMASAVISYGKYLKIRGKLK